MQKVLHLVIFASLFLAVVATKVSKPSSSEDKIEISKDDVTSVSSTNSNNSTRNDVDFNTDGETETVEENTGLERIECPDAFERFMLQIIILQSKLITKASEQFHEKSFCVSGMSTVLSIASLFLNSQKSTLREISHSLGIDQEEGRCVFKTVSDYISSVLAGTFVSASVIFANDEIKFTENFIADFNTYNPATADGVLTLDIKTNPSSAGDTINEAISTQTNGEITNVITTFKLPTTDTQIGLAFGNKLFSRWLYGFESDPKKKENFFVSPSLREKISFMKQVAPYKYIDNRKLLDAKVVEIPLEGNDLAFLFVVPNKKYNHQKIARQLENPDVYNSVIDGMKKHLVTTEMPPLNVTAYLNSLSLIGETRFANTIQNENTLDLKGAIVGDIKAAVNYGTEKSSITTTTEGGVIPYKIKQRKANIKMDRPYLLYLRCLSLRGLVLLGGAVVNPADMNITM